MPATASRSEGTADPVSLADASRVVQTVESSAWAQALIRALAAATNLSVASTPTVVVGSGPLALALVVRLRQIGARVTVIGDDAPALLALAEHGADVSLTDSFRAPSSAGIVLATGESGFPVSAGSFHGGGVPVVLVDAALPEAESGVRLDGWAAPRATGRAGLSQLSSEGREVFLLDAADAATATFGRASADIRAAFDDRLRKLVEAARSADASPAELVPAADAALAAGLLR